MPGKVNCIFSANEASPLLSQRKRESSFSLFKKGVVQRTPLEG